MTTATGLTFLAAQPGHLFMKVGDPSRRDGYLSAFRDMVESLCLLGITRIRALKDGLHVAYDVRIVDAADLEDMLTAADAAVLGLKRAGHEKQYCPERFYSPPPASPSQHGAASVTNFK